MSGWVAGWLGGWLGAAPSLWSSLPCRLKTGWLPATNSGVPPAPCAGLGQEQSRLACFPAANACRFEIEFLSPRPPGLGRSQAVYAIKASRPVL